MDLSPREFEILKCLILHENEIVRVTKYWMSVGY